MIYSFRFIVAHTMSVRYTHTKLLLTVRCYQKPITFTVTFYFFCGDMDFDARACSYFYLLLFVCVCVFVCSSSDFIDTTWVAFIALPSLGWCVKMKSTSYKHPFLFWGFWKEIDCRINYLCMKESARTLLATLGNRMFQLRIDLFLFSHNSWRSARRLHSI